MRLLDFIVEDGEEVHNLSEIDLPVLLLVDPLEHFLTGKQNQVFSFGALFKQKCTLSRPGTRLPFVPPW